MAFELLKRIGEDQEDLELALSEHPDSLPSSKRKDVIDCDSEDGLRAWFILHGVDPDKQDGSIVMDTRQACLNVAKAKARS